MPDDTHYSVLRLSTAADGMDALRTMFPTGESNDLNLVLFSTSGVHGTYHTIEDVEAGMGSSYHDRPEIVTFLIVQPRRVALRYGVCRPESAEDIAWLRRLRASSHKVLARIGLPVPDPRCGMPATAKG